MWELIRANQRRAATLVVAMAALLFLLGYALGEALAPGGGAGGLVIAFLVWVVLSLVSYFQGDTIFLSLAGARRIAKADNPQLYNVVEEMTIAAGLPTVPAIYVMDQAAPNAFATGRDAQHAAVAVTAGLLETLDRNELQGVIAHELGHVKNRDVLYMMMVGIMMGAIVLLADVGGRVFLYGGGRRRTSSRSGGQGQLIVVIAAVVLMILAPIIAQLIYLALSRRREYLADASSALFTRYPEGLASALEKIARTTTPLATATRATAPMYIVNPLGASAKGLADLTSTHPPTSERIRILRSMGGGAGLVRYDEAFRAVTGKKGGVVPPSALAGAGQAPAVAPVAAPPSVPAPAQAAVPVPVPAAGGRLERVRQTTDMLWRLNQFVFIPCACGTTLKVPPAYVGREIACPHCGAVHKVQPSAA
ncbi:MAG: M48 family metallopeptidase [Thermoanaerobaculaceae bacterium]|nr:M48 family metallopeptidase [Thermoanaerobaculaceae bacterium]TAM48689.1 MAG: peptidase M28 [Acidobacteriota bacterium]